MEVMLRVLPLAPSEDLFELDKAIRHSLTKQLGDKDKRSESHVPLIFPPGLRYEFPGLREGIPYILVGQRWYTHGHTDKRRFTL